VDFGGRGSRDDGRRRCGARHRRQGTGDRTERADAAQWRVRAGLVGDLAQARKLIDEAAPLPLATADEARIGFRQVDALIRMERGDRTALDVQPAPKDDHDTGRRFMAGFVNLALGNTDAAAQMFKQILDRQRPTLSSLLVETPLYYGRALAKLGKADESRKAYEQFFDSWKNADAGLPLLAAAKKEYAALGH
jgi:tetratricopeptide (TPR) repeat protein